MVLDPVTRLEGGGRVELELTGNGGLGSATFRRPQRDVFEAISVGRPVEEMGRITSRIWDISPASHHLAAAKAADAICKAPPSATAKKVRELSQCAHIYEAHAYHFYLMAAPDLLGGNPHAERCTYPELVSRLGRDIMADVVRHCGHARHLQEVIGGRDTYPVSSLPGGVSVSLSEKVRLECEEKAKSMLEFAKRTLRFFDQAVLKNTRTAALLRSVTYTVETYNMGIVDAANKVNFYDGDVRLVDPDGAQVARFPAAGILQQVEEHAEEWSLLKFLFLKKPGWKGFQDGKESGVFRVGPLARLTAADGMATPQAQIEYDRLYATLGIKPVHHALAMHWARLIELLYAAERMLALCRDRGIAEGLSRQAVECGSGEGAGAVESPQGTIFHHYQTDGAGIVQKARLTTAVAANYAAMNISLRRAAEGAMSGGGLGEGSWRLVEMALRAY